MRSTGANVSARPPRSGGAMLAWIVGELAICFILCGAATAGAGGADGPPPGKPYLVRIGIAPGTWSGVNRSDAQAAIKAWARIIMSQHSLPLEVETQLYESEGEMTMALGRGQVDAVSMLSHQFLVLEPRLRPGTVFLATRRHSFTERYVLLAHRNRPLGEAAPRRERRLLIQTDVRTCLIPPWLDTLLAGGSLGPAGAALKTMSRTETSSKAVLQLFFCQADACVVTAAAFELASELNPQLRRDLTVLATSPEVVPAVFFFLPERAFPLKAELESAIVELHETVAGSQVLTVFRGDGMVKRPVACLEATQQLLERYHRLGNSGGEVKEIPR